MRYVYLLGITCLVVAGCFAQTINVGPQPGLDFGAAVNQALKAATMGPNGSGKITIPPGSYTFSTTISLTNYPNVILDCQGANLTYTGSTIAIDALQIFTGTPNSSGGIENCNVYSPSTATAGVTVFRMGSVLNYKFQHNTAWNFDAAGDVGLLVENATYFTEDSIITDNQMRSVTIGYEFLRSCQSGYVDCTNSMEYTFFRGNYYNSPYISVSGSVGLLLTGGIALQNSVVELHANINGPSGGYVIEQATANDEFLRDQVAIQAEADGSPSTAECWHNLGLNSFVNGTVQCDAMTFNTGTHEVVYFGSDSASVGNETYNVSGTTVAQYGIFKATGDVLSGPFTANISSQTLYTVPSPAYCPPYAGCTAWYDVSCIPQITTAATTSSTLPSCSVSYNDGLTGTARTVQLTNTATANTVGTAGYASGYPGTARIYVEQNTPIVISTSGYASSGATAMVYKINTIVVNLGQ